MIKMNEEIKNVFEDIKKQVKNQNFLHEEWKSVAKSTSKDGLQKQLFEIKENIELEPENAE